MDQQSGDVGDVKAPEGASNRGRRESFLVRLPSRSLDTSNVNPTTSHPFTPMGDGNPTTPFGSQPPPPQYDMVNSNQPAPRPGGLERQQTTSVEQLVSISDRQQAVTKLGIHDTSVEAIMPVLPGQEFHLASWLTSGRTLAEPTWAFRTKVPIDEHRLRGAWAVLRRRHPIMRSTLVAVRPDEAFTVVLRQASGASNYATFSKAPYHEGTLEERVKHQMRQLATHPSSLKTPPTRLTLVQGDVEEGDAVLITIHHAACDTRSMGLLMQELTDLYRGKPVVSKAPSFRNFVKETLFTHDREAEEEFWKDTLHDCEQTIVLPEMDHEGNPLKKNEIFVRGTMTSSASLEKAAEVADVTPPTIIYLAFSHILAEKTGSSRPVFGCFHNGRESVEGVDRIKELIGPLSTMLPTTIPEGVDVSHELNNSKSKLITTLQSVHEHLNSQVPYEQSRLRDVLRWADMGDTVPFNTYLNILWNTKLQGAAEETSPVVDDLAWERMDLGMRSDYSSASAIPGATMVDVLDTSTVMRKQNVFVDVGSDREEVGGGVLEIRLSANEVLMNAAELEAFAQQIDTEVAQLVDCLLS
ncbi:Uu.00g110320.m01.CDS01 [Anthostomella pinea]|uniref:Uu.00g110320.m01.CDS01 n=1 Tax=Anthostomella pinea TaxID=933095 RepID=A0AAI8VFX6_9PEZI|nr:Uu.00g110320.m01.CDS01 [Anthostomella pinea]